jgi:hypothetical protein
MYEREKRRTAESSVQPALAAKHERPEQTFNSDRAVAIGGKTDLDHPPAVDAIDAIDAIGAMVPHAEMECAYGREERRTAESCARPARAAKRELPEKTVNSDRAAAFDGKTNFDHRPAVDAIGAMGAMAARAEFDCAYAAAAIGAIGAMAARAGRKARKARTGIV